jgi:hypothetical protein
LRDGQAARLALATQSRAVDKNRAALRDWADEVRDELGPVAAVAVEEQDDCGPRVRRRYAAPDGSAVAPARLDHHAGAGGLRPFGRAVARAAIHHDHLRDAPAEDVAHDGADRVLLVEAGNDGGDEQAEIEQPR